MHGFWMVFFCVTHSEQSVGARGPGDEIIERQIRPLKKTVAMADGLIRGV